MTSRSTPPLLAFVLGLALAGSAVAQSVPAFQAGQVQPNDIAKYERNGSIRAQQLGSLVDNNGMGVNPFAATDFGQPGVCSNSAPATGGYSQVCIGHDSSGKPQITAESLGGAPDLPFEMCSSGACVEFPFAAGGIVGESPSAPSYAALWGNSVGTLLKKGQPAGEFSSFAATPAVISRMGDRLFVGKNTNVNDGGFHSQNLTMDWLETIRRDTTSQAMIAALSQNTNGGTGGGGIAILGGQRTSDQGSRHPADVEAVSGFGVCDAAMTESGFPGCWAGYYETRVLSGAAGVSATGVEIDIARFGAQGPSPNPYNILYPGMARGLMIASGAGDTGASAADVAISIATNTTAFQAGLVFDAGSLLGSDGSDTALCCGNAIQLGREQAITFWNPTMQPTALIHSSANSANTSLNLNFRDSALSVDVFATGLPAAEFQMGRLLLPTSTLPVGGCGADDGHVKASIVMLGSTCTLGVYLIEDETASTASLTVGAGNTNGFTVQGLPTVGTGTGRHLVCIDATTKQIFEGTGATCS